MRGREEPSGGRMKGMEKPASGEAAASRSIVRTGFQRVGEALSQFQIARLAGAQPKSV